MFLPPVQLTPREALALCLLCGEIAEKEQIPFTRPAWMGLTKLLATLPASARQEAMTAADSVVVQTAAATPPDGHLDVYQRVQRSIATRTALRCRYEAAGRDGDDGEFEFEPYALYFAVRAWYAVGLHNERDGIRTLKLNRFTMVSPTERSFQIPDGFSLDGLLGNAWRMIRGEPDYEVELRFDPQFAETIADTLWHKTQRLEEHEDGSLTFRCTVAGLNEIVWWVLSMGPHCRVIAPEELREQVKNAVRTTADLYS